MGCPEGLFKSRAMAGIAEYRSTISGPMKVLGQRPDLLASLARYVECKCLLGGTTTSQGIELFSNAGARRFYRGIVRNVEQTNDPNLPEAGTRIPDVDANDAKSFLARISQKKCYLLHLAEGRRYDRTQTFPSACNSNPASGRSLRHWREFTVLRYSRKTST